MSFGRRWFLILSALLLGAGQVIAAGTREERAYAAAAAAFQDGSWSQAESGFAQFLQHYPKSNRAAEAGLLQAQAEVKQHAFTNALANLKARLPFAGSWADQYDYWTAQAQFQAGDLEGAAETFAALGQRFPTSSLRLRAAVEAASVRAAAGEWALVGTALQATNGVFWRTAQIDAGNELVSRGRLLLAQAALAQQDVTGAAAQLALLVPNALTPELDWKRAYLLYQVKIGAGDLDAALAVTTNLLQIARLQSDGEAITNLAVGTGLQAGVLEQLGRGPDAAAVWQDNLTNAPVEWQREAMLKIAALATAQTNFAQAEASLEKFLAQFAGSAAADVALLTLGELQLRDYLAQPSAAADQLPAAREQFDQFLGTYTNSPLTGRAYLDRGWCDWLSGKFPESLADFRLAARTLPPALDQAVARFKVGDVLFEQGDFAGARAAYQSVLTDFSARPDVAKTLGDRALYQIERAALKLGDTGGADTAMRQLLERFPASELADNSQLLAGEGFSDFRSPTNALQTFRDFERQFPDSPLTPEVELAVARTFEQQQDWSAAITNYAAWRQRFPTNELQAQVLFAEARASYQAGREAEAFGLFSSLVTRFPNDELAPTAQFWVADHYFRATNFTGSGNYIAAETNYENIFQSANPVWAGSSLIYPAQLMAGRAAMARQGYSDAIRYFTGLLTDTNCPPEVGVPARFAYGRALMQLDAADTNKLTANLQSAIAVFDQIRQLYPTNESVPLAWSEIGNCYYLLAAQDASLYDKATNAFAQVINLPGAGIGVRSRAQVGIALALKRKAATLPPDQQRALLAEALSNCREVLYQDNLLDGEVADDFWVKEAGLQALPLMIALGENDPGTLNKFFQRLEFLLPQLRDSLELKKVALLAPKG